MLLPLLLPCPVLSLALPCSALPLLLHAAHIATSASVAVLSLVLPWCSGRCAHCPLLLPLRCCCPDLHCPVLCHSCHTLLLPLLQLCLLLQMGEYEYHANPLDWHKASDKEKRKTGTESGVFRPPTVGRVGTLFNKIEVTYIILRCRNAQHVVVSA